MHTLRADHHIGRDTTSSCKGKMFILNWSVLADMRLRKWRVYINQKVSGLNLNVEAVLGKILMHLCVREGVCLCVNLS